MKRQAINLEKNNCKTNPTPAPTHQQKKKKKKSIRKRTKVKREISLIKHTKANKHKKSVRLISHVQMQIKIRIEYYSRTMTMDKIKLGNNTKF